LPKFLLYICKIYINKKRFKANIFNPTGTESVGTSGKANQYGYHHSEYGLFEMSRKKHREYKNLRSYHVKYYLVNLFRFLSYRRIFKPTFGIIFIIFDTIAVGRKSLTRYFHIPTQCHIKKCSLFEMY